MPSTIAFIAAFTTLAAALAAVTHARVVATTKGRMARARVVIRTDRSRAPGRR